MIRKKCRDNLFAGKCKACPEHKEKKPAHNTAECESDSYSVTEAVTNNFNSVNTKQANSTFRRNTPML